MLIALLKKTNCLFKTLLNNILFAFVVVVMNDKCNPFKRCVNNTDVAWRTNCIFYFGADVWFV